MSTMMTNTVTGKAALLMAAGSSDCATENCVLCGRFLPLTDRLPYFGGPVRRAPMGASVPNEYAHVTCLLATAVRS